MSSVGQLRLCFNLTRRLLWRLGIDFGNKRSVGSRGLPIFGNKFVLGSRFVDRGKGFTIGADAFCNFCCSASKEITTDDREVRKKFSNLGVGKDEGEDSAKVLYGWEK